MNITEYVLYHIDKGSCFKELLSGPYSRNEILKEMHKLKVSTKDNKFDRHIFDVIDTEEKAYWLGFIYADGSISCTKPGVEIKLKGSDYSHLVKFHSFLKAKRIKVSQCMAKCGEKSYPACRIAVRDKHLYSALTNLGLTPRKSTTKIFPNTEIFSDKNLIRHFIRGYFDGNGCIMKADGAISIQICSTESFLTSLNSYFEVSRLSVPKRDSRGLNVYRLNYSGNNAMSVLNYMYKDCSVYLDRKYELYRIAVLKRNL